MFISFDFGVGRNVEVSDKKLNIILPWSRRRWWPSIWHHLAVGGKVVAIYSTSSCCGEEVSGQLVDIISWVVIYSTSSCSGEEVSGQLVDIFLCVVNYSTSSCEWPSIQHHLVSGHLFNIILWMVIGSTSSCEWLSIQHHLVSGPLFNIILWVVFVEVLLKGGGVRTTQGATVFVCRIR